MLDAASRGEPLPVAIALHHPLPVAVQALQPLGLGTTAEVALGASAAAWRVSCWCESLNLPHFGGRIDLGA